MVYSLDDWYFWLSTTTRLRADEDTLRRPQEKFQTQTNPISGFQRLLCIVCISNVGVIFLQMCIQHADLLVRSPDGYGKCYQASECLSWVIWWRMDRSIFLLHKIASRQTNKLALDCGLGPVAIGPETKAYPPIRLSFCSSRFSHLQLFLKECKLNLSWNIKREHE